jgi:hypothetical protein
MNGRLASGAGVTVGATLAMGGVAQAACTCTVNSLADPTAVGHTTLRDALTSANSNPGSTVTFASGLSGTITLGSALPSIYYETAISGPGADRITVSGNNSVPVFDVYPVYYDTPVTISGLTIAHGKTTTRGGGVHSDGADLVLTGDVISGNTATSQSGGGVAGDDGGSLTIVNSTISGNSAPNWGGGVMTLNLSGTETRIVNSTISDNHVLISGGGAYFDYSTPATVVNSTVYGNSSGIRGGGLFHYGGPSQTSRLTVTGSTITNNSAGSQGGGVGGAGDPGIPGTLLLQDTIVAHNMSPRGPDVSALTGAVTAAFSLIGEVDPTTTFNQTGPNIIGQDPQLTPLAMNGGPTATQRPAPSSPAIDKGSAFGLKADQRGTSRPFIVPTIPNAPGGDGSDIGAVELQPSDLPPNAFTAKVKGQTLIVSPKSSGHVAVADAKAPLNATAAKKKRGLLLGASNASGGPRGIKVKLRLTKFAKQKLRQKGKVGVKARVTFTPNFGLANTRILKLRISGTRKK